MEISQSTLQRSQLGRLLIERRLITEEQLAQVILTQQQTGKRIGELLVEQGWVTPSQIARALRKQTGMRKWAAVVALIMMPFQMARAADVSPSNPDVYSARQHDVVNTFEAQLALANKSGVQGIDDQASIHQNDGEANLALILQAGSHNLASIEQSGGSGNAAAIIQTGRGETAAIVQSGKQNTAQIIQR